MGYELDGPGSIPSISHATASRPVMEPTQPPIQCVPGAFSLGVKQPGREAYHSFSATA
jgi:hypothetical protein